jgi:hypothetical protein
MYGPEQGNVITDLLIQVAKPKGPPSGAVKQKKYNAGIKLPYHFGVPFFGERYSLPYEDLEPMMPDAEHRPDDGAPRFEWTEAKELDWETRDRHVRILRHDPEGWKSADDDLGVGILTVIVDGKSDPRRWTAIWVPSDLNAAERAATYVFWVQRPAPPASGKLTATPPVRPPAPPPICSEEFQLGGPIIKIPMDAKKTSSTPCPEWSQE